MRYKGTYPLHDIKYFRPEGIEFDVLCPKCQKPLHIDAGDDLIEYPKRKQMVTGIACDCGEEIHLSVKIKLQCIMDIEIVSALL
jgi:hypothetical protein